MKKFLVACLILFVANVGCKKMNVGGERLCGCSPVTPPELNLVIKNSTDADLLSDKTAAAYTKDQIQFYRKDAEGKELPLNFNIRTPFQYDNKQFKFHSLVLSLHFLDGKNDTFYLKLGTKLYQLQIALTENKYDPDKLLIDGKEAPKDADLAKYTRIFYLTEN